MYSKSLLLVSQEYLVRTMTKSEYNSFSLNNISTKLSSTLYIAKIR